MKPTTPTAAMTAAQLTKAIAKLSDVSSALCSEMIAAGRGHELSSTTRKLSDPLALRCNENSTALAALYAERSDRRTYHGSDRPIKRPAAY